MNRIMALLFRLLACMLMPPAIMLGLEAGLRLAHSAHRREAARMERLLPDAERIAEVARERGIGNDNER